MPRLVRCIDDAAAFVLRRYFEAAFTDVAEAAERVGRLCDVVELGATWTSHFPHSCEMERCVGVGVNGMELSRNFIISEPIVQDLGVNPWLPGICSDSVDLVVVNNIGTFTSPRDVFGEALRILRPKGTLVALVIGRCARPRSLVTLWRRTGDTDGDDSAAAKAAALLRQAHCAATFCAFARTPRDDDAGTAAAAAARFEHITMRDCSPDPGRSDGVIIVRASKSCVEARTC